MIESPPLRRDFPIDELEPWPNIETGLADDRRVREETNKAADPVGTAALRESNCFANDYRIDAMLL